MSRLDDIPQPWHSAMDNAGTYSLRELATKTGVGTSTVSDLIYGRKQTSERTMQAVADTLRLPVTTIREWAGQARGVAQPFVLPTEANLLDQKDREAVLAIVRRLASARRHALPEVEPGQLVDLARPAPPDVEQLAARKGPSEGRHLRQVQDDDAES